MSRQPSMFTRLVQGTATRLAADPSVPESHRAALAAAAEHVIWAEWRDLFGGERVRLRAPDVEPNARQARARRIQEALSRDEPMAQIARRENVRLWAVQRINAKRLAAMQGAQIGP